MSAPSKEANQDARFDELVKRLDRLETTLHHITKLVGKLLPPTPQSEEAAVPPWQYLVARSHPWRRQLYVKGRNLTVRQLLSSVKANKQTAEEAAANLSLPVDAIREAVAYADENQDLLEYETAFEQFLLAQRGYSRGPQPVPR